jgi:Carboxypeptidase regulatory-like domain
MRTLPTPFRIALSLLAFCLGTALPAQPEARADVLSGRVTDLTGKPLADARVITTASGSGISHATTTDASGHYRIFFPGLAPQYRVQVKLIGFTPVQRTITRHTKSAEQMTIDLQMGGAPLALSLVEIEGSSYAPPPREPDKAAGDASVPNPLADILAMKDTLHLSAVQIVELGNLSDTLQTKNTRIYSNIRALLAKSADAGDVTQMAGTVAMMLEEAAGNTSRAVGAAQKLLRSEQWEILPQAIRDRPEGEPATTAKQ